MKHDQDHPPRWPTAVIHFHRRPPQHPSYQNRRHVITKVINQQSVTVWFYKINILHGNNKDSRNHFLTIERLLDALSKTTPEIHITNKKSGGGRLHGRVSRAHQRLLIYAFTCQVSRARRRQHCTSAYRQHTKVEVSSSTH